MARKFVMLKSKATNSTDAVAEGKAALAYKREEIHRIAKEPNNRPLRNENANAVRRPLKKPRTILNWPNANTLRRLRPSMQSAKLKTEEARWEKERNQLRAILKRARDYAETTRRKVILRALIDAFDER
jgi:hypothetical protein